VGEEQYPDTALVILGHGTSLNEDSAATVYQHANEIRRRRIFTEVREAFWKQSPHVAEVIEGLHTRRVFLLPLFISEGYFSEDVIPRALGFTRRPGEAFARIISRSTRVVVYCQPIGTHEAMTNVILDRAQQIVARFPFPRAPKPGETTLFIAGHGTKKNENSRKPIDRQVELIRGLRRYATVEAIFLEQDPRIGDCYQMAPTRNMIIVPFFISEGLHTREDIPRLLGEPERVVRERLSQDQPTWRNPTGRNAKLVWYSPSVGTDSKVVEVILERVREAASWELPMY